MKLAYLSNNVHFPFLCDYGMALLHASGTPTHAEVASLVGNFMQAYPQHQSPIVLMDLSECTCLEEAQLAGLKPLGWAWAGQQPGLQYIAVVLPSNGHTPALLNREERMAMGCDVPLLTFPTL